MRSIVGCERGMVPTVAWESDGDCIRVKTGNLGGLIGGGAFVTGGD